jgi:hypothetical protein
MYVKMKSGASKKLEMHNTVVEGAAEIYITWKT